MPLVMEGRNESEKGGSNIHGIGTDVNFGELTKHVNYLTQLDGVTMHFHHEVQN
jgi:malate dehydrogenase (quinone)